MDRGLVARLMLLVVLVGVAVGCGSNADTKAPQVERPGAAHPPGEQPSSNRPQ